MKELNLRNLSQRRRVVIHHTHLLGQKIVDFLRVGDVVFFDDCLFSQYSFLKENQDFFKSMAIDCILGFSSGLYASEDLFNQLHDVESNVLHDACNASIQTLADADKLRTSLTAMWGFMKVSQLKELLRLPFCHLALHGCCHLNLSKEKNLLKKMQLFKNDLDAGCHRLKELELETRIFVYPYVYSFPASDVGVRKNGFAFIIDDVRMTRIPIEDLLKSK